MFNLPEIELLVILPKSSIFGRVWKCILTEDSERNIFGDLNPYREHVMPPLFLPDQYYINKEAWICDAEAQIYNFEMKKKYKDKPFDMVQEGIVEVNRSGYNVSLRNVVIKGNNSFVQSWSGDCLLPK